MRKLLATLLAAAAMILGLGTISPATAGDLTAQTSDSDYCYLSQNWRVNGSATWYGNGLSYTVLSSPGTLINGGEYPSYSIANGSATTNRWASYYQTSPVGATPKVYRSDHYGYNTSRVTIQVYGGNAGCYMVLDR